MELVTDTTGKSYFNRPYLNLLSREPAGDGEEFSGKYVDPGVARTSPLIWHLFGRNLSRPWDGDKVSEAVKPIEPGRVEPLTEQERQAFVEWVDMGALWDGIPGPDALPGGH